jgi:hypothetical protein
MIKLGDDCYISASETEIPPMVDKGLCNIISVRSWGGVPLFGPIGLSTVAKASGALGFGGWKVIESHICTIRYTFF